MKTLNDYLKLPYRMELMEDLDEGGYVASYPDLKGCITCADTLEQVIINAKEAKREWLQAALEVDYPIPEPNELEKYSGQFKLRLPRSLHRQLAQASKKEGVSMNQYCVYLLSKEFSVS